MTALVFVDRKNARLFILLALLIVTGSVLASCSFSLPSRTEPTPVPTPRDTGEVTVIVVDPGLVTIVVSVLNADLTIQAADNLADDGILLLPSCGDGQFITAWSPGYTMKTQPCANGSKEYSFDLDPYNPNDNPFYAWAEARNAGQPRNCEPCHSQTSGPSGEYPEWQKDGHATVFKDQYFWTVYLGADVSRNRNPEPVRKIDDSGRRVRLPVDLSRAYFGPGFRSDNPADNGNCAYCHAPASVSGAQTEVDLSPVITAAINGQSSAAAEGVTCDVCHKVLSVNLAQDNKPFPDRPGVLSFDFAREAPNDPSLYFGPSVGMRTDNISVKLTCAPVFSRSQFCAPCHYAKFGDTQIYNSYGEWLDSPYSNQDNEGDYKTCQACHMPVNALTPEDQQKVRTAGRRACVQGNTKYKDFNHNMMARFEGNTPALIKDAASLKVEADAKGGNINVKVRVVNERAGHKFPTDSPLRHLILLVEAKDKNGTILPQVDGPTIPLWGGTGNNPAADFAGRPGVIYANILMDKDTNNAPTIAYWNFTQPAWENSDTRLAPRKAVDTEYVFTVPSNGAAKIIVKLIYRYAFIDIARQKGWSPGDILVTEATVDVP